MLFERKLSENELEQREAVLQGLLKNKRNLVKKYGKDAEKVMYGIATKKAKSKVESMNKEKIRELIYKSLTKEEYAADKYNVNVFGYQTRYYKICPGAKAFMDKVVAGDYGDMNKDEAIRLAKMHDLLFLYEIRALKDSEYAAGILDSAVYLVDVMKDQVQSMGMPVVDVDYLDNHVEVIRDEANKIKEDNDPSGENLEGDPGEHVEENLDENASQDSAVMELRNIVDELEEKAEEAREIVRQYFPNELSRLDGYGVFDVAYSGNRYNVTLGKFVDGLEDGDYDDLDDEDYVNEDNNVELKGKELVDYIMGHWNWSEEKTLNWLANNFGKNKQDDGPKEKDPRYIDYLRRSGRDEYADELEKNLEEAELTKPETKKIKDMVKSLRKSSKGHAGQANYLSKLVKEKVVRKKLAKAPKADKVASKQKMKTPSGLVSYMDFSEQVYEKLTKKNDVGDYVDDFKKSDAKQFKGKSDKKKKQMAVAAYLSKQND
jgi:hypothetical protein